MSAARLLDELLSGFAPGPAGAQPDMAPAKPAKAANRQQACGSALDSAPCESARRPANQGTAAAVAATHSQEFAAVRGLHDGLGGQQPCGVSQDSQLSQWLAARANASADLAAVVWSDGDISRFLDRRARLLRWGWPEIEAEGLAERLTLRDRAADQRVTCIECSNYNPGRCSNHRRAGLNVAAVGRDLAAMLQRCPGFEPVR